MDAFVKFNTAIEPISLEWLREKLAEVEIERKRNRFLGARDHIFRECLRVARMKGVKLDASYMTFDMPEEYLQVHVYPSVIEHGQALVNVLKQYGIYITYTQLDQKITLFHFRIMTQREVDENRPKEEVD